MTRYRITVLDERQFEVNAENINEALSQLSEETKDKPGRIVTIEPLVTEIEQ
jgi:hypothetical protein